MKMKDMKFVSCFHRGHGLWLLREDEDSCSDGGPPRNNFSQKQFSSTTK
jgi:hypothetical protein